jgi:hypothetical protein
LPSTFNSNAASLPRRLNLGNFYPRTSCESTISAATALIDTRRFIAWRRMKW